MTKFGRKNILHSWMYLTSGKQLSSGKNNSLLKQTFQWVELNMLVNILMHLMLCLKLFPWKCLSGGIETTWFGVFWCTCVSSTTSRQDKVRVFNFRCLRRYATYQCKLVQVPTRDQCLDTWFCLFLGRRIHCCIWNRRAGWCCACRAGEWWSHSQVRWDEHTWLLWSNRT